MIVTILRGLPGSGKSTYCKEALVRLPNTVVCSADDFFMIGGEYKFNPELLPQAHAECLHRYVSAVRARKELIIVDNTNILAVEIAPYYALAEAYKANVEVITINCPIEVARERNIHGVPSETMEEMARLIISEVSRFPPWWNRSWKGSA